MLFLTALRQKIRSSSPAPPTGQRALVAKADGWYDQDSSGVEVKLGSGSGGASFVPYFVASGDTFSVPDNQQALFAMDIELDDTAALDCAGILVEVD